MASNTAAPAQLGRVSTVDAIVADLRRQIFNGEFAPGTELKETELAERYGVGRHSVRAAIQALAHRGVIRHVPHRGAFVPRLTVDDVNSVYTLRAALELEAVRILSERPEGEPLDPAVIDAVEALERVPPHTPWEEIVTYDLAVHRELVAAAGSPHMLRAYDAMLDELWLCLSQWPQRDAPGSPGIDEGRTDHRAIIEAIDRRDCDSARSLLDTHLKRAAADIEDVVNEHPREGE
jgi:DNA-binding GntR family transcriptional regulator